MTSPRHLSLFPFGIAATALLVALLGAAVGMGMGYLAHRLAGLEQAAAVGLLGILVATLGLPAIANRFPPATTASEAPLAEYSSLASLRGMRGVPTRLLLYADRLEVRAMYHRYIVPVDAIKAIQKTRVYGVTRYTLDHDLAGFPRTLVLDPERFDPVVRAFGALKRQASTRPA